MYVQKLGNFTMHAQAAKALSNRLERYRKLLRPVRRYFCASEGLTQFSFLSMCHFYDCGIYDAITVFLSSLCKIHIFSVFSRSQMVAKTSRQRNSAIMHLAGILALQTSLRVEMCNVLGIDCQRAPCDVPGCRRRDARTFSCQKSPRNPVFS